MTINVNETFQEDAAASNGTEESKRRSYWNFLTFTAILKIVCLISEFSGFICALCGGRDDLGVVKFFYIIILIALISTVIWFILYFIRRNRNPWSFLLKVEMYYHATGSIILLLAAVLILGYRVQALLVASVFGFITAVGYVVETLFNYLKIKRISQSNGENEPLQ